MARRISLIFKAIISRRSLVAGAMGGFSLDATDSNNFARLGCQGTYDKYELDNNNSII